MAGWPIIFGNQNSPNPVQTLDQEFAAVAAVVVIPCTVLGANALALTPMNNAPTLAQYSGLNIFSFIASATVTGPVTASFYGLSFLPVYAADGVTQVGAASVVLGFPYFLMYSAALNGGLGGFYLLSLGIGAAPIVSPGMISNYAGLTDPPGWYICNGRAVSRTTDAPLFAVCGTTWGVGDGSTTFNIPDGRGNFKRGLDQGAGIDPGRALGTLQTDAYQDHTHSYVATDGVVGSAGGAVDAGQVTSNTGLTTTGAGYRAATETRPRNYAFPWIIKR